MQVSLQSDIVSYWPGMHNATFFSHFHGSTWTGIALTTCTQNVSKTQEENFPFYSTSSLCKRTLNVPGYQDRAYYEVLDMWCVTILVKLQLSSYAKSVKILCLGSIKGQCHFIPPKTFKCQFHDSNFHMWWEFSWLQEKKEEITEFMESIF